MEINEKLMLAILLIVAGISLNLLIRCVDKIEYSEMYLRDIAYWTHKEHDRKRKAEAEEVAV